MNNENFELMRHDTTPPLFFEVNETYNLACSTFPKPHRVDPIKNKQ